MLNKLCNLYNSEDLVNVKNLIQSYYRRNQRLYREQTIYLNSFLYGLRKDYPTIFKKSPYIIENTLSDCISTKERLWWQLRNMFQMTEQFYVDDLVQNMLDPLLLNSTANITIVVV